jgi:hypothetical protein
MSPLATSREPRATDRPSPFPDYYAEERRACRRVRVRQGVNWVGLVVGVVGLAAVCLTATGR